MTEGSTPAGWYPDPQQPGQQRYWDGAAWTDSVSGGAPVAAGAPTTAVGYGYAQGVPDYATFGARFFALLIDWLIILVPLLIVFAITSAISDALGILVYILGLIGGIYYFAYFEGGPTGQTIGMKQMRIRVVDATSLQPGIGMGRGVGRYFAHIISGFVCYLGYFWMLWDPEKQCWHDKIVSTKVLNA